MHPARYIPVDRRIARVCSIAVAFSLFVARVAHADASDVARAKDAYDRGVRAHASGDHAAAATAFAEADALAPTVASLEAALEAAMRADDAVLGAELLERSEARPERDTSLSQSIEAAKKRFAGRTGAIRVECHEAERCLVSIDGHAHDAARPIRVLVGPHTVVVQRGEARSERLVAVESNGVSVVGASDRAAPASSPLPTVDHAQRRGHGISPVWFWIGAGATVLVGAAATVSGLDALGAHDDFVAAGCAPGAAGPKPSDCDRRSDEGAGKTLRTNALIGLTALLAINTAVLGTVFVRWSSPPSGTGGVASLGGVFP